MKNLWGRLTLAASVMVLLTAPAIWAGAGKSEAGKAVYDKKCATCHGAAGEGKPAVAKMLKAELRHLGAKEVQAKPEAQLRKDIVEGTGKMKPVKGLNDADLANLIAFVRTLKQK